MGFESRRKHQRLEVSALICTSCCDVARQRFQRSRLRLLRSGVSVLCREHYPPATDYLKYVRSTNENLVAKIKNLHLNSEVPVENGNYVHEVA